MFETFNYFRQYNNDQDIKDFKSFYRSFSNNREFGGEFTNYDHLVKNRFSNTFQIVYNAALRRMPNKILDVGCGNGVNLPLSKILPVEYHGLDYAEQSISAARTIYPNVNFHLGDAFSMEFEASTFDMVILSSVLILYKDKRDQERLINECMRVLKPNGVLVLTVWNAAPMLYAAFKISRVLGGLLGENLPQDFNGIHFSRAEVKALAARCNSKVTEVISAGQCYGVLECVRYLNFAKYRRRFGKESESFVHPQNVFEDLAEQAGRYRFLTFFCYKLSLVFPSAFSFFSVNMLKSNR
jgi:ubiquinone/menaquinone biosynthesis C-methylase UbiE